MKTSRIQQIERLRARMRSHPALYGEMGDAKEDQAERILRATSRRLAASWKERADNVAHEYGQRLLRLYA